MRRKSPGLIGRSAAHLDHVGESWRAHGRFAFAVGSALVVAGVACLIHALVPAFFPDKASRTIRALHGLLEDRAQAPVLLGPREDRPPFGLLALLSLGNAATPWAAGAAPLIALPLSLLSLALLIAIVVAATPEQPRAIYS